jgi:hypothetical protein
MKSSFVCATCGETHEGAPTDYGWKLPDEVWAIPEIERSQKAKFDSDLCQLGNRFFIRCVLKLPFTELRGYYAWGIWVEVAETDFYRYVELYSQDGRTEPPIPGSIANTIPTYPSTLGLPVAVQFQDVTNRPTVDVTPAGTHILTAEQTNGIDSQRYHEILVATGVR